MLWLLNEELRREESILTQKSPHKGVWGREKGVSFGDQYKRKGTIWRKN